MFSAICIQESWLSEGDDISLIQLEGYECIPQGKVCSSKGGLIIYLHEKFKHKLKLTLNNYTTWEGQVIEVTQEKTLSKPLYIGNIYRPPKENLEFYDQFINEFTPILEKLERNNKDVILSGDFNIDLLKINERNIISEYFNMLTSNSFYPKITVPTRLTNTRGTLIDNFLCKLTENTLDTTSGVLIQKLSDHQPYFISLNTIHTKDSPPVYVKITKQNTQAIQQFYNEILTSDKLISLNHDLKEDPNNTYNILHNVIQDAKNKHIPCKLVKFSKYKHKKSKWVTFGIIKSIQYRDNLYKKLRITNPTSVEFANIKINLNTYNKILKNSIRLAKRNYYHTIFAKFKNDIRSTWKTINEILNRIKQKKSFAAFYKDENNIVTNKLDIVNKFNSFFTNTGTNLSNKIKMPSNKSFKDYLKNKFNLKFTFHNIDEEHVSKIIDKLSPKTSFGFDGLSSKLLKSIKNAVIKPITTIINQMINTGIFPDKLKIAKIVPIYKKDDETQFTNYRPISLLPTISKIFEKIIFKQLYEFFFDNKLLYNSQYGFREGHSTEYAALELVDRITLEMDNMNTPVNIFLDLSKAFDTLDHQILIKKLEYYGIHGLSLKLMESYLFNRKQYVEIDEYKSDMLHLTTGVPQGSILGPLLFIIYINDIAHASKLFDFIIYADDTTMSTTIEMVIKNTAHQTASDIINKELSMVNNWLKLNKLSLNIKKSKYMIFHTKKKNVKNLTLIIDNVYIERVAEFNFLGLTLDEHLTWKCHINKISNKISQCMGILNRLKRFLPMQTKVLIYNSLVLSHLNFGILIWGFKCEKVAKLQKKVIRILSLSKYNAHTEPLFKRLKLLKISDILKLQELKFYYKYKNNKLPHYLQSLTFQPNTDTHAHATRIQHNIHQPITKHVFAKNCIRFDIPITVNNSPNSILNKIYTHSLQGLSGYIKAQILQTFQENCTIMDCYVCNMHT